jgi:hypothetical protein
VINFVTEANLNTRDSSPRPATTWPLAVTTAADAFSTGHPSMSHILCTRRP